MPARVPCTYTKLSWCLQAYQGKGQEYQLAWPPKAEFVRMAAKFGATIVPFASIGVDDSVNMLLSPEEVQVRDTWVCRCVWWCRQAEEGGGGGHCKSDGWPVS